MNWTKFFWACCGFALGCCMLLTYPLLAIFRHWKLREPIFTGSMSGQLACAAISVVLFFLGIALGFPEMLVIAYVLWLLGYMGYFHECLHSYSPSIVQMIVAKF